MSEYVCEKTNKERFSKEEAISRAVWWRRNRAARMQAHRSTHMDPHCHHRQPMGFLQALSLRNKLRESDDYDGPKLYVRRCKRCHGWFLTTLWIRWSK